MAKRTFNPFAGRVDSDEQRRQLQLENSQLYEQREISRSEYERAARQINAAYENRRAERPEARRR